MTVAELVENTFDRVAQGTEYLPYTDPADPTTLDLTLAGSKRLLRYLNLGLVRVANWRFPDGTMARFRGLDARAYFTVKAPVSGTAVSATSTTVTVPGLGSDEADEFNGWVFEVTDHTGAGQKRLVVDSAVSTSNVVLTVDRAWDTNPDNTSDYEVKKAFFGMYADNSTPPWKTYHLGLDPFETVQDVQKVRNVSTQSDLAPKARVGEFTAGMLEEGDPAEWTVRGSELWFDVIPSSQHSFEVMYVRHPAKLTASTQVPELPASFHEAIELWAAHAIQMNQQDFQAAYATKRDLQELMQTLRSQGALSMDRSDMSVAVY